MTPPCPNEGASASFHVAFIGSAGIPNRYGGFESFLEHCAPVIAKSVSTCTVTCDAALYEDRDSQINGVKRRFIGVPANGNWSVLHDLLAFANVFPLATHIVVLGVSGGPWFPLFRLLCSLTSRRLIVNIDGVEWRRSKFGRFKRMMLRCFDWTAQMSAHTVIYDSPALQEFVAPSCRFKATQIAYSGDQVLRLPAVRKISGMSLTICRIEPENNIEMILAGALRTGLTQCTVIGNWTNSTYGTDLRARYGQKPGLCLLDPIYDPVQLAELREQCEFYIHGHSVGGTNPSLVEMLYYDCRLLCFDCSFNRATAGATASYFSTVDELERLLREDAGAQASRTELRRTFSRESIARAYLQAITLGV